MKRRTTSFKLAVLRIKLQKKRSLQEPCKSKNAQNSQSSWDRIIQNRFSTLLNFNDNITLLIVLPSLHVCEVVLGIYPYAVAPELNFDSLFWPHQWSPLRFSRASGLHLKSDFRVKSVTAIWYRVFFRVSYAIWCTRECLFDTVEWFYTVFSLERYL